MYNYIKILFSDSVWQYIYIYIYIIDGLLIRLCRLQSKGLGLQEVHDYQRMHFLLAILLLLLFLFLIQ